MSPRRSVKISSPPRRVAGARSASRKPEFNELAHLVSDIRTRLSSMSQEYGAPVDLGPRQTNVRRRPTLSAARVEAEALYRLVQTGRDSLENVRGLIAIPPQFEQGVKELRFCDPSAQKTLLASLQFRKQVLKEFESLVVGEELAAVAAGVGSEML